MPSQKEIQAVLDSQYVPQEKKDRLMQALLFGDMQSAYDDAKADMDAGLAQEKQATDARDKAKTTLDGTSPPAAGGTGAQNSNELLDQGKPACDFLCQWIDQIWNKRPSGGTLDYMKEIWGRYNRDRNINFGKLFADADDLTSAHKVNDDTMAKAKTELDTLFGEWKGQGANAARVKFEETIQPDHKKLQDQIDGAAKLVPQTATAVFNAVKTKVDSVLGLYRTTVAQATLETANKVIKIARKETDEKSDLLDVAHWVDSCCGSNLYERLQDDDCGLNDENRDYAYDLCAKWVAGSFTPEFQGLIDAFDNYCETAHTTVEQQLGALSDYMKGYHNEFTESAQTGDPSTRPSGDGGTGNGGGGGTGGGGSGGGGGAMPSGGGGSMPSTPTPGTQDPAAVAEAAKKEAEQGTNPLTGKPLEINPETGEPYPIDPKTGEAIKDSGQPETVTVQQGDNKIEMSEPDKQGKMDIKVDDGHGNAKDYKLDWGDGKTGQDGAPADPAHQTGEKTYTPGPDGKIHIEDGNLKITAERPQGPDGPTVVTVDDGTGKPTTYTLGGDDAKTAGTATPGQPVQGATTGPEHAAGAPTAQQSSGFTAPGGIDIDHPADPAASATGGAAAQPAVAMADGTVPGAAGAEPVAAGTDTGQTTPANATGGFFSDSHAGGLFSDPGTGAAGGDSGFLGDAGSLQAGPQTGVDQSAHAAAVGVAPSPNDPASHQAALGASGFGAATSGSGGMGMMSGMMGGMGGMGAGGGGEDTERGSRAYRVDGGIFNTSGAGGRISGSLDDEGDREVRL
ncbi:MAG TPA: hypothetical protein VJT49_30705 [Amycolatopsis sp.]|uniref:WXG100 family type VII secretion target n=1 Tax=Amycolatopsis sp. TaxID=37632 RepID=UPI002B47C30B|nr:hypothetical protein [Amycolatopsis sp.]HKS49404.1 hypothetical protein [Amycolatopsis sp.]